MIKIIAVIVGIIGIGCTSSLRSSSHDTSSPLGRGGLRTICRVRPPLTQELHEALRMNAGLTPVLRLGTLPSFGMRCSIDAATQNDMKI